MDCKLSRRQMLRFLTVVLPTTLLGFKTIDYFADELVCVHIYDLSQDLPAPFLQSNQTPARRLDKDSYFQIGLPELILCRTEVSLLDMFTYFWPVTRPEIKRFQNSSTVLFSLPRIERVQQLAEYKTALNQAKPQKGSLVVILTLNAYTHNACRRLVNVSCQNDVAEMIIFKDPSKPPYLCRYPSRQKGFKKKPPIGEGFKIMSLA